ncbi:MAG TPA: Asp-tRNA(Asn)/Glu-tRNA(Gln) amidotransferase subunit GatB [Vicinamibacterales bacterium]|nr:Asp-tRNA(Asn)/Glu-tRNA(Gln) amidotransferase subunit GatB [Vicinamibacterales bacterium]
MRDFEPVIGLEIHAQLLTATKIFCGCSTRFGAEPNRALCPVCAGLPGALPVLNRRAVELAARAALALGCRVHTESIFARKNYFYPDLPKGYQISQYDRPLATGGAIAFTSDGREVRVGITRIHMEEDAGKSLHEGLPESSRWTHLDFNRSGVPLIEIVTEPDLRSAADAAEAFSRVREVLVAVGVNDGNMEEGSLRCDANVSVRPAGDTAFGVKTELKNLNSFRHVQRALEYEIERHAAARREGVPLVQETRLWDPGAGRTTVMRTKEEADDYRYFPEPDLPPLVVDVAWIEAIRGTLPELPEARRTRFVTQYQLPEYDAGVLTQSMALADYFERVAAASGNPKAASNWVMGELTRKLNETRDAIEQVGIGPDALGELIALIDGGRITGPVAKEVFEKMYGTGRRAADIVAAEGLGRIDDPAAIDRIVAGVLDGHAATVAEYRAGKTKTFGFLVGQVMKATAGKADPARVNESVRRVLGTSAEKTP